MHRLALDSRGTEHGELSRCPDLQRRRIYDFRPYHRARHRSSLQQQSKCTVWAAAAGGGVWRTDNALSGSGANWTFVSGSFATNAIGTLTYDAAHNTLYAGTGEPNASADSEAGFGIYKSTDGGNTWTHLAANTSVPAGSGVDCDAVFGPRRRSERSCVQRPGFRWPSHLARSSSIRQHDILYVASARGVRGVSSVSGGGAVSLAPGLPPYGLWKSTDGGANFTLLNYQDVCLNPTLAGSAGIIQASFGSTRGVHEAALDPGSSSIVYAAPFPQNNALPLNTKGGVWRSTDSGATWTQIKNALNASAKYRSGVVRRHTDCGRIYANVRGRRKCPA